MRHLHIFASTCMHTQKYAGTVTQAHWHVLITAYKYTHLGTAGICMPTRYVLSYLSIYVHRSHAHEPVSLHICAYKYLL